MVQSFGPNLANGEKEDADHLARRLWYAFKETNNRCACGMVRLAEPLARDVVGVVTTDDLFAESSTDSASLDDCVLSDDLAEYIEERFSTRFGVVPKNGVEAIRGDHGGIEMTLIEPQTKEVFKRSQGDLRPGPVAGLGDQGDGGLVLTKIFGADDLLGSPS